MNTNVVEPTAAEKVYTFRKLEAGDVFPMFKILGKIGINEFADAFGKDTVQKVMSAVSTDGGMKDFTEMMGISITLEMVNIVLNNLPNCEHEIYQLLSKTSNLTPDQVKGLDFPTFTDMVIDFVKKDEFKDFIKVVSALFK